jgi:succinyl-diaminopimelate desuccinylase
MRDLFSPWVDAHQETILSETQAILRIPSVKEAPSGPDAPFGQPCADALTHTLALCERLGFRVQRFGGYAGHAEFGPEDAPEYVAALGHLDVVPTGDPATWSVEPFGAVVKDGWLFARGASDDKGPTFAALFAAKAVLDSGMPLKRRIRLIFGCDEESGWECMDHYFGPAGQPQPTYAFAPDADFPLIFAEKGAFTAIVTKNITSSVTVLRSGLRANMVPESATATLTDGTTLLEMGKSAHGSTPEKGENAAVKLLEKLGEGWASELAHFAEITGAGLNLKGSDAISGALTCNLGVVSVENQIASGTINVRYPATWSPGKMEATLRAVMDATGWNVTSYNDMPPLYVPVDAEPVKTLLAVYREHTGDMRPPVAIGGRTYATAVSPVGVAFGAAMPGDPDVAHQPDERILVERLIGCTKIYADALFRLANLSS